MIQLEYSRSIDGENTETNFHSDIEYHDMQDESYDYEYNENLAYEEAEVATQLATQEAIVTVSKDTVERRAGGQVVVDVGNVKMTSSGMKIVTFFFIMFK